MTTTRTSASIECIAALARRIAARRTKPAKRSAMTAAMASLMEVEVRMDARRTRYTARP